MEGGNLRSLQPRPYDVPCCREFASVPVGADEVGGGFEVDDVGGGGCEEDMSGEEEVQVNSAAPPLNSVDGGGVISSFPIRPSELTVSFEGQVYVFPAVTPDKVQLLCMHTHTKTHINAYIFNYLQFAVQVL